MKRTGIFVTADELSAVKTAHQCSGMWLSNGRSIGDPEGEVKYLVHKYKLSNKHGLDLSNGEFVEAE